MEEVSGDGFLINLIDILLSLSEGFTNRLSPKFI